MKKIFLPLLALVGMVSCFTLSSCGGGGGSSNGDAGVLAGKTYVFTADGFGGMCLEFSDSARGNTISAAVSFASKDGASAENVPFDFDCGNCDVIVRNVTTAEDGAISCTLVPTGIAPESAAETGVLIFMGLNAAGVDAEDVDIVACSLTIDVPKLPTTFKEGSVPAQLTVTQLDVTVEEEVAEDEEAEIEDKVQEVKTATRTVNCARAN